MTSLSFFSRMAIAIPAASLMLITSAHAAEYKIDSSHSKIGFTVKHLMISKVSGTFKDFEGTFEFDKDKGVLGSHNFVVKTASVDTQEPKRDEHLKGPDFFDVAKFPTMTFAKTKISKDGKDKYKWAGDLTIHGVTKPVTFDLEYTGSATDPWGNKRAGFTATTKISRKEFGLVWNKAIESGGVVVGDEVTINLEAEAIEQVAKGAAPKADDTKKKK